MTPREAMIMNLKQSAIWHKEHCHDADCGVSLTLLRMTIEELGGKLTLEEQEIFL